MNKPPRKPRVIVLSGAGMSAESGINTFRGAGGLWEGHNIMEVASPQGWEANKSLVLDFYNKRRQQLKEVTPNSGHLLIAEMEKHFDVVVITQNVDDLHERAGSKQVLHLHGELKKARSEVYENIIYHWEDDLHLGDLCEKGTQLRPHIVWFGELVPLLENAAQLTSTADFLIIVGTSLQVYPAAGLYEFAPQHCPIYYIDPHPGYLKAVKDQIEIIPNIASQGLLQVFEKLKKASSIN